MNSRTIVPHCSEWPLLPASREPDVAQLRQNTFCGLIQSDSACQTPDVTQFNDWTELIKATQQLRYRAAAGTLSYASILCESEVILLRKSQAECFPVEIKYLKAGKPVSPNSRLGTLSPEMDTVTALIHFGGRLRRMNVACSVHIHPIVLNPCHAVTHLPIKAADARLIQPGLARVFADIRRQYWILHGSGAIKRQLRSCTECRQWRGKPIVPFMADIPPTPFFSMGVDCLSLYAIEVGRHTEKCWGVIFECLTTRCVQLDLLTSLDAFLLAVR